MSNEINYVVGPETKFNQELARDLDCELIGSKIVQFPDHEFKVVVDIDDEEFEDKNVVVSMQLDRDIGLRQAQHFTEMLFLTGYLAQMNANVIVSMPYLMFGRQDKFFEPGEGISVQYMLNALASAGAKKLVTFEAHLQREKGLLNLPGLTFDVINVSAIPAIVEFIKNHYKMNKNTVILAPDKTAYNSAKELADPAGLKAGYLNKKRLSATDVVVAGCSIPLKGKSVIVFDDIASTGGTLVTAVNEAKKRGAKETTCIVVHPVLAKTCFDRVAPVTDHFYGTNTIKSKISKINIIPLLAKAIQNA